MTLNQTSLTYLHGGWSVHVMGTIQEWIYTIVFCFLRQL